MIHFVTAGGPEWASSRMRAYWVARQISGAQVHPIADLTEIVFRPSDRAIVFQKTFHEGLAAEARKNGLAVFWDICDPLHWFAPEQVGAIIGNVDVVVACSDALANDLADQYGITPAVIGDGIDPGHFNDGRPPLEHHDGETTRIIWYGLAANRVALASVRDNLARLHQEGYRYDLTVFDDRPDVPYHIPGWGAALGALWSLPREVSTIRDYHLVLIPPFPGRWGEMKTNNRWLTAAACGVGAVSGLEYDRLVSAVIQPQSYRQQLTYEDTTMARAAEWLQLLEDTCAI